MRLCILMPAHWSGRLGGAEIQVRYLLGYLQENTDYQMSVICRHSTLAEDEGVPIHRIRTAWPLARYSYLPDYPSVQRLLRHIDPDVVYSRVGSPLVGFAAQFCKRHRRPLVHHIARLDDVLPGADLPSQNMIRRIERRIYEFGLRRTDAIIAQANYQAALLKRHFGHDHVEVISNYHPVPPVTPAKDPDSRVVVWVANIKRAKRPEIFIELARRFQNFPNTRFVMVGAMSDNSYAAQIAEARHFGNFEYAGSHPLEETNTIIASAHVFVNTSFALGEGFPNTFIQAWLRGVPVVSLEVNPDSLLTDGRLGLSSANSVEQLVSNLQGLLDNRDRLARMASFARSEAMRRYGSENLARIQTLLEQSRKRAR